MLREITFIHAPLLLDEQTYGARFAPLWAYTLAAYLPDDWHATVVDVAFDDASTLAPAAVFAFSGINQDQESLCALQARLKAQHPKALFVLGGPIVWSFEQEGRLELLDGFDYLFVLDGEETLPRFLRAVDEQALEALPRVIRGERFALGRARPIAFDLYRARAHRYDGAAIEVSRGCPFLCEFCDVRAVPGNDRANNKPSALIVRELEAHAALGVERFLFVCDNFIGDLSWARECARAIVAWRLARQRRVSIFTWLTINLAKSAGLMKELRRAGFSALFIGIESVNQRSLLETAKVQNRVDLESAVTLIQSHGFIVVPGLIFGFDSDTSSVFEDTQRFLLTAGIIAGDPSFLTALPGTPLFERMKRTSRLVQRSEQGTVRRKLVTNIRYLQSSRELAEGFVRFMADCNAPRTQLARFRAHLQQLMTSDHFTPNAGEQLGSPWRALLTTLASPGRRRSLVQRGLYFVRRPTRAWAVLQALWLRRPNAPR